MFGDFFAPRTSIAGEFDSHETVDNAGFIDECTISEDDHRRCHRHCRRTHLLHWFHRRTLLLDSALHEIQTRHRPRNGSSLLLIAFELYSGGCTATVFVDLPTAVSSPIPSRLSPSARTD